ncbi:hypothetical protein CGRA01v4_13349 [Colletotrichum graminicola]|nr:hypothetical protein CGRA01v4_13349 [Colletotrichum graminicola]
MLEQTTIEEASDEAAPKIDHRECLSRYRNRFNELCDTIPRRDLHRWRFCSTLGSKVS